MSTTSKCLGTVEFSGKVVISDPCYDRGSRCMKTNFPVRPGRYRVYAAYSDEGSLGLRVAALTVCHEAFKPQDLVDIWQEVDADIGVDSGQCGVFDDSIFPYAKDSPDHRPFYDECCDLTSVDSQAGILQSGTGVVSSSGYGDGGYTLRVVERDGKNVALLLDYDLENMRRVMTALLATQIDLDQIIERVIAEHDAYREATQKLSGQEVYDKAFEIHLWEEMAYLICECSEDYEDDLDVLAVLDQLTAGGGFLPAFVEWAMSQDSVDVTNIERTCETLGSFCESRLDDEL